MSTMKKITIAFAVLLASFFFTTFTFANNNLQKAGDDVRNVVGNAENGLEDIAGGVGNAVRGGFNTVENDAKNVTNGVRNTTTNTNTARTNTNKDNYGVTRTATETTFAGMNATTWTWFILAIAALAIVGLVWYYASQRNTSNRD